MPGDVIQVDIEAGVFAGQFMIICSQHSWGYVCCQNRENGISGYARLTHEQVHYVGKAVFVPEDINDPATS